MQRLPEVTVQKVVEFLAGRALGQLATVSMWCRDELACESQWFRVVRQRFFASEDRITPRMCGAATWARAYRELNRRCAAPRTWLTPRHARVFAKGRAGECAMWVTLGHASDCRTRRRGGVATVELRVLVQNLGALFVGFRPADLRVSWLCCGEVDACSKDESDDEDDDWIEQREARVREATVFARSHASRVSAPHEFVEPFEWVAVMLCVECPDCSFELDFLERATAVTLPFVERSGDSKEPKHARTARRLIQAPFVSTDQLYKWYSLLPGGCVSLTHHHLL